MLRFNPSNSHWRRWLKSFRGDTIFLRTSVSPIVLRPSCKNLLQPPNGLFSRTVLFHESRLLHREPCLKKSLHHGLKTLVSSWKSFVDAHRNAWLARSAFLLP